MTRTMIAWLAVVAPLAFTGPLSVHDATAKAPPATMILASLPATIHGHRGPEEVRSSGVRPPSATGVEAAASRSYIDCSNRVYAETNRLAELLRREVGKRKPSRARIAALKARLAATVAGPR